MSSRHGVAKTKLGEWWSINTLASDITTRASFTLMRHDRRADASMLFLIVFSQNVCRRCFISPCKNRLVNSPIRSYGTRVKSFSLSSLNATLVMRSNRFSHTANEFEGFKSEIFILFFFRCHLAAVGRHPTHVTANGRGSCASPPC